MPPRQFKILIIETYPRFAPWFPGGIPVRRILKPIIFVIATLYIGVDAVFLTVARPVADWVGKWKILDGLGRWIASLRPYSTLALFMVPVVVLEPLKPA